MSSFICSFFYAIGFFVSAYCGVLTNQHLFTLLTLFCIYILISKQKFSIKYAILIGVLLAIANIIRTEAIIYLLGIVFYLFLNIKNKTDIKKFFINTLTLLIIYFVITHSISFFIQKTGINQNGLANKNILWKFVCGLDYESNGQYSKTGELIFDDTNKELEFILNNLKMPLTNYINLAKNKISIFWRINDYNWVIQHENINFINNNITKANLLNIVNQYDKILFIIVLIFLFIHLIDVIIKKHLNSKEILLIMLIIINFFIYLIIEVQSRYSYTSKTFIYILASGGINYIIDIFCYRKEKKSLESKDK